MDLVSKKYYYLHGSQDISPVRSPPSPSSLFRPHLHHPSNSFPIVAVAIIGILATAFLLVSYYIFVIKCCLNWHRIDLLQRFSFSTHRQSEDPLMAAHNPAVENRGLDEAIIRSIPIFQFKKGEKEAGDGSRTICECSVCLNEFQENEKLRVIPNCCHVFHIDCIDVWLQHNANCPLCRTSISSTTRFALMDQMIAPTSSPQDPNPHSDNFIGSNEDYVVIELGEEHNSNDQSLLRGQERLDSGQPISLPSISPPPPRKSLTPTKLVQKKGKRFSHASSMGDECIDVRGLKGDNQFAKIQPIRRSFSMDSATDRQLYLAVQEILQQNNRQVTEVVSPGEGCSSRVRRTFFSFGHGRGSRTAVLPVHLKP